MNENKVEIVKGVEFSIKPSLDHTPARDHFVNVIKASLSAIPLIGGPISSLIGDYIPKKKEKRLHNFIRDLTIKLEEHHQQINSTNVDYIKTEEFAFIFEESIRGVLSNYQKQKIFCYKGIIINSLRYNLKSEQKEYFLHLVNNLSDLHLRIISISNNPDAYFEFHNLDKDPVQMAAIGKVFQAALPGIDLDMIKSAYGEIYQMGLFNTDKSIFGTMTSSMGFRIVSGRLTPLGRAFIDFCTNY